jgi:hypothetical protein
VAYEIQSDDEVGILLRASKDPSGILQNRPNPFRDVTTIFLHSDKKGPATLRIYDYNGKLVHSRDLMLEAGENEIIVHKSDLRNSGVYWYEIESTFQYRTNRMIIVD